MKLDSVRREYKFSELSKRNIDPDPVEQFGNWLDEAIDSKVNDPTAMSISTIDIDGFPDNRIVLLKDFSESGFTFFTNFESEKGRSIAHNNKVALLFFWPELERQVRIKGTAQRISNDISDIYFQSRPITSQIAAIISNQSEEIPDRSFLENRFFDMQEELHGNIPVRPSSWGGFIVKPEKIEFWQGRESRLHDRILYIRDRQQWKISRLAP